MSEACKFQVQIEIEHIIIQLVGGWKPSKLQFIWKRGERRKKYDIAYEEDDTNSLNISCKMPQDMLVTLYKSEEGEEFAMKNYCFDLEDVVGLSVKRLATCSINIAEHVGGGTRRPFETKMKLLSQKVVGASLKLMISSNFLKTGSYSDSDMESNFSHVSEDDSDTDLEEVSILQLRANQRKTCLLEDLDEVNKSTLNRFAHLSSIAALPQFRNVAKVKDAAEETVDMLQKERGEVKEIIHQVCDDDFVVRRSLKIKKIELENEALRVRNAHLLSTVGTYKHDVEMMQLEIDELHRLVQEFRIKLQQAQQSSSGFTSKKEEDDESYHLSGWLCKRGVKGGPLGRRWKKRWFAQSHDQCLYYYKKKSSLHHQGFIELDQIIGVQDVASHKQDKNSGSFNILTQARTFSLMAHDEVEKQRWINTLDHMQTLGKRTRTLIKSK